MPALIQRHRPDGLHEHTLSVCLPVRALRALFEALRCSLPRPAFGWWQKNVAVLLHVMSECEIDIGGLLKTAASAEVLLTREKRGANECLNWKIREVYSVGSPLFVTDSEKQV